jgi:[acyl-carrier-protein] S-malonyltransferase
MSVALLFSPQGSQTVGMGRELAAGWPEARAVFEAADAALGWSVSELAWNGPADRLNETRWTQPALLTTSIAALAALRARINPNPAVVAGHSVGEYAALVAAGVLEFEHALRLVARRGELMTARGDGGGMAAVMGLDREVIQATLEDVASPTAVVVANDNAPGQVVVSGTEPGLAAAEEALRLAGARRFVRLNVSGPFHSPHMAEVTEALTAAFDAVPWADARVPVISNVTAKPETDAARLRNLLAEQVRSPVEWVASVRCMAEDGVDTFVECGPGTALAGMVRRIVPEATVLAVSDRATLDETVEAISRAATPAGASV